MKELRTEEGIVPADFGTLSTFGMKEQSRYLKTNRDYFGTLSTFGMKEL